VASRIRTELGLILAWLAFPVVPVVLEDLYYQIFNLPLFSSAEFGPDPYDWSWLTWVVILGPLIGFGFLAGATVDLPDPPVTSRRLWRRWLARRSVWVAFGPWCGFLFWVGVFFGLIYLDKLIPATLRPNVSPPQWWSEVQSHWSMEWAGIVVGWIFIVVFWATLAYGWVWPGWAALRRAARVGRWGRALYRGLVAALAFLGSLFGSFWAITSAWRNYFFDSRIVPLAAVALGLAMTSGCAAPPITYGEVRRRGLFHAMLVAWVLGLALMWRWWSRRRPGPGPPRDDAGAAGGSRGEGVRAGD
jgi:hypothetical protein